jgi:ubiquinone/menaquinone biosynthesis C-methylase UbiE
MIKKLRKYKKYLRKYLEYINYNPKIFWNSFGGKKYFNQFDSKEGERNESIFLEYINKFKPRSIIDIGCGYGRYLKVISKKFPNIRLVGVDISSSQIEYAREYCKDFPNIEFFEIDGKNLPFDKGSFDMSITYGCLQHIKPKKLNYFFKQIKSISKYYSIFIEYDNQKKYNPMKDKYWHYNHNYSKLFENKIKHKKILNSIGDTLFVLKY